MTDGFRYRNDTDGFTIRIGSMGYAFAGTAGVRDLELPGYVKAL